VEDFATTKSKSTNERYMLLSIIILHNLLFRRVPVSVTWPCYEFSILEISGLLPFGASQNDIVNNMPNPCERISCPQSG
jgi:hypothetical protein